MPRVIKNLNAAVALLIGAQRLCFCADDKPASASATAPELWFYYATNLQNTENLKPLEAVFRRAAAAGVYRAGVADQTTGSRLVPPGRKAISENAAKVKKLAEDLHLEIVPAVFPMGWSEALLSHNPDLVETLPVRDALFVVKNGVAQPVAMPPVGFPDDGFYNVKHWAFVDPVVHFENGAAHVTGAKGVNARAMLKMTVAPFHQYHLTVRIRTRKVRAPDGAIAHGLRTTN